MAAAIPASNNYTHKKKNTLTAHSPPWYLHDRGPVYPCAEPPVCPSVVIEPCLQLYLTILKLYRGPPSRCQTFFLCRLYTQISSPMAAFAVLVIGPFFFHPSIQLLCPHEGMGYFQVVLKSPSIPLAWRNHWQVRQKAKDHCR